MKVDQGEFGLAYYVLSHWEAPAEGPKHLLVGVRLDYVGRKGDQKVDQVDVVGVGAAEGADGRGPDSLVGGGEQAHVVVHDIVIGGRTLSLQLHLRDESGRRDRHVYISRVFWKGDWGTSIIVNDVVFVLRIQSCKDVNTEVWWLDLSSSLIIEVEVGECEIILCKDGPLDD